MKARRGRPAMPDGQRKRNNVTIRMRPAMRMRLEQLAAQSDRSVSEEIERRIETSMTDENMLGTPEGTAHLQMIAGALMRGGRAASAWKNGTAQPTELWLADPYCYQQATIAVLRMLLAFKPGGAPDPAGEGCWPTGEPDPHGWARAAAGNVGYNEVGRMLRDAGYDINELLPRPGNEGSANG